MHLGRLAIFFGVLAIVGLVAALSERKARARIKAKLRARRLIK